MTHKIMTSFVSHQAADQLYDLMNKCTVVSVHRHVLTEISTLRDYGIWNVCSRAENSVAKSDQSICKEEAGVSA